MPRKQKIEREGRYGRYKSKRRYRQISVKVPEGRTVVHYKERKPKAAKCAEWSAVLKGIANKRKYKMGKMAKSKKRVSRKYGGYLCSRCARKKIIEEAKQ